MFLPSADGRAAARWLQQSPRRRKVWGSSVPKLGKWSDKCNCFIFRVACLREGAGSEREWTFVRKLSYSRSYRRVLSVVGATTGRTGGYGGAGGGGGGGYRRARCGLRCAACAEASPDDRAFLQFNQQATYLTVARQFPRDRETRESHSRSSSATHGTHDTVRRDASPSVTRRDKYIRPTRPGDTTCDAAWGDAKTTHDTYHPYPSRSEPQPLNPSTVSAYPRSPRLPSRWSNHPFYRFHFALLSRGVQRQIAL